MLSSELFRCRCCTVNVYPLAKRLSHHHLKRAWHQQLCSSTNRFLVAPKGIICWILMANCEGSQCSFTEMAPTSDPKISHPLSSLPMFVPSRAQARGGCQPEHGSRSSPSQRSTERKAVCKIEKDTYHAFTLYCNLSVFCMCLLLWVCIPFPPVLTLSFFCGLLLFLLSNLQPNWEILQWLTYLNIIA